VLASLASVTVIVTKPPAAAGVKAETGAVDITVDIGVTGTRAVDVGGVTKVELIPVVDVIVVVDVTAVVDVGTGTGGVLTEVWGPGGVGGVVAAGPPVVIGRNPDTGVDADTNISSDAVTEVKGMLSAVRDGSAVGLTRNCELSWTSTAADSRVSPVTCDSSKLPAAGTTFAVMVISMQAV